MTKKALIVGTVYVRNPDKKTHLPGTFTDLINMRNFCIDVLGYKSKDITLITDEYIQYSEDFRDYSEDNDSFKIGDHNVSYPSRRNILNSLKKLISETGRLEECFVFLAGHGIQDTEGYAPRNNEKDLTNEIYLAVSKEGYHEYILDNDFNDILNKTQCKTTAIFDCCHSATIVDAPKTIYFDINKKKITGLTEYENENKSFNNKVLVLSGARDRDYSYDATDPLSLSRCGSFTLSLLETSRKLMGTDNKIDMLKLLKGSTEFLASFHDDPKLQVPHASGKFIKLSDITKFNIEKCSAQTKRLHTPFKRNIKMNFTN